MTLSLLRVSINHEGFYGIDLLRIEREWWSGSLLEITWSRRYGWEYQLLYL